LCAPHADAVEHEAPSSYEHARMEGKRTEGYGEPLLTIFPVHLGA
jgi:hypothetical protein